MAVFKEFSADQIQTKRGALTQVFEIPQTDISSSTTRKAYQVFVTGGVGPGVTSSLFQTIFDQAYTSPTANPIFDITIGLAVSSSLVQTGSLLYVDSNTGKYYFSSQSLMMREKMDMYRLHAQELLGGINEEFQLVSGSTTSTVREALFIDLKRLVMRDQVKRGTFAIRLYQTASSLSQSNPTGEKIFTDVNSTANIESSFAGQVSTIVNSNNTSYPVGLLYCDKGIAMLDITRVFDQGTFLTGNIDAMDSDGTTPFSGSFSKLLVSASVDDILDHICQTKFSSSTGLAMAFGSNTFINSTFFQCMLGLDEFNYSSNPTYVSSTGRIRVIDPGQEETQRSFTFITSIGLYDAYNNLLGIARPSRPIYKDDQRVIPIKIKLDF